MADRYLLESGAPDGYLLEDGTGVLLLEAAAGGGGTITPVQAAHGEGGSGGALGIAAARELVEARKLLLKLEPVVPDCAAYP